MAVQQHLSFAKRNGGIFEGFFGLVLAPRTSLKKVALKLETASPNARLRESDWCPPQLCLHTQGWLQIRQQIATKTIRS